MPIAIFAAGSGTKADPYTISSVEELVAFRNAVNAGDASFNNADLSHGGAGLYFKLAKSLDLSSVCGGDIGSWEPIGTNLHPFLGHFDGDSKVIDNLYINRDLYEGTIDSGYGLFGVGTSSDKDTLTISNVIIGENSRVEISGNVSVGAVLGFATGNVVLENCENRGYVHGRMNVGGIVGFVDEGYTVIIRNCVNKGSVDGFYGYVGGIAGEVSTSDIMISKCENACSISAITFAAGIVGKAIASETKAKIEFCKNTANVSSSGRAAGIAFFLKNVSLESVYNSGNVKASQLAAGIVDSSAGNVLHYMCVNTGEIEATALVGGIAAYSLAERSIFSKCLNVGTVYKTHYTGGIVAYASGGTGSEVKITNCVGAGKVFDPFAEFPEEGIEDLNKVDGVIGFCGSATCNKKYNLNLLTLDTEGGFQPEDLLGNIPEDFDDTLWLAKEGLYPQVNSLANHSMEEIRAASLLAATPKASSTDVGALGSKSNPLTITSLEEFLKFRNAVNDSSDYKGVKLANAAKGLWFSLEADIDLKTVCGKDIGSWKLITPFSGNFEGNGHTISNLYMDELEQGAAGLFGPLFAEKSVMYIQNFNLDSVYIHVESESACIGAISSQAVTGKVVVRNVNVEGLDISIVGTDGASTGSVFIGGIMCNSVAEKVVLESDTVRGKISIENQGTYAGGLMGAAPDPVTLKNNATYVEIEAKDASVNIGGLVGQMVTRFEAVGNTNYGNIKAVDAKGYSFIGGIFGVNPFSDSNNVFKNCENKGNVEVSGTNLAIGGIAGMLSGNRKVDISNVVNSGKITVTGTREADMPSVGGIAGIYNVVTADSLRNTADITIKNADGMLVGGIAGNVRDLKDSVVLWNSENTGKITIQEESVDSDVLVGYKGDAIDVSVKTGERNFEYVKPDDDDDFDDDDSGKKVDSGKDDGKEHTVAISEYSFDAHPFACKIHRISSGWSIEFLRDESVSSINVFNMLGRRMNASVVRNGRGFDIVNLPMNGAYIISLKTSHGVKNIKIK